MTVTLDHYTYTCNLLILYFLEIYLGLPIPTVLKMRMPASLSSFLALIATQFANTPKPLANHAANANLRIFCAQGLGFKVRLGFTLGFKVWLGSG